MRKDGIFNDGFYAELYSAVKTDDLKKFDGYTVDSGGCGNICYGRFPVLSLIVLFGAKKLFRKYAETFFKCSDYVTVPEPADASVAFAARAGKCLRLYLDAETVSPLEMLMILDKT